MIAPMLHLMDNMKAFPPLKQPSSFILSVHLIASQSDAPHFIKTPRLMAEDL